MGSLWRHGSGPQARPPVGFSTGQPVKAGSSSTRLWAAIFGWLLVRYRFPCPPSPVRVRRRPPMSSTPCRPSTSRGTFAIPTTCPSSASPGGTTEARRNGCSTNSRRRPPWTVLPFIGLTIPPLVGRAAYRIHGTSSIGTTKDVGGRCRATTRIQRIATPTMPCRSLRPRPQLFGWRSNSPRDIPAEFWSGASRRPSRRNFFSLVNGSMWPPPAAPRGR